MLYMYIVCYFYTLYGFATLTAVAYLKLVKIIIYMKFFMSQHEIIDIKTL